MGASLAAWGRKVIEGFQIAAMILKAIGSLCGAAMALAVKPPKTQSEFFTRLACSIVSGILFSTPVRDRLGWSAIWEYDLAAATIAAFSAWWIMAAVVRIIEKWEPKK